MYARVQPTVILLNKRPRIQDYAGGLDEADFRSLARYFDGRAPLMEIPSQSGSFAVFIDEDGELGIATASPGRIFDATNIVGPASLNQDVSLLVNMDVYSPSFSTGAKRL